MTHKLLHNEQERWKYFWSFLRHQLSEDSVWKPEDRPLLEPYFKYSRLGGLPDHRMMNNEEFKSFTYWKKCRKEYADELFEVRDSLRNIHTDDLVKAFGYEIPIGEDNEDDDYDFKKSLKSAIELNYPAICVNWIESGYNRGSKEAICAVDYVELKEFELKPTGEKQNDPASL